MRAAAAIAVTALALAACGAEPEKAAPTPVDIVSAAAPVSDAEAAAPAVLTAADLRGVCQAGLAEIHGQGVGDIQIDGLEGRVVNASWRAPSTADAAGPSAASMAIGSPGSLSMRLIRARTAG